VSPGILLLFHRIKEAILEGYEEIDLLRGHDDYKMAWANGLHRCLTIRYYNRHVRAAALKLLEGGKATMKILLR
jgi:CelD/BcsL family acetyltransferase involved in cellulose biosynthesis